MFTQLLASRPVRERTAGGLTGSVLLHGAMIGLALYATMRPAVVRDRSEVMPDLVYPMPKDPAPPPTVEPPVAPPNGVPPVGPIVIDRPLPLPSTTDPLPSPVDYASFPIVRGPIGVPTAPIPATPASAPFTVEQVEVPVSMATGSALPRYPSILRSSGLDGTARFRFVVDTAGRVEMNTVEQLEASHVAFADAVRATLPRMKFLPAQVGGQRVRQLVELPFVFKLTR